MHQLEGSVDSEVRPYGTLAVAQPCDEEAQQCARHVAASPCGGLLRVSQRLRTHGSLVMPLDATLRRFPPTNRAVFHQILQCARHALVDSPTFPILAHLRGHLTGLQCCLQA
jgi:hypothetical protein